MYEKYDQIDVTVLPVRALKQYSPISFFFIFFFFFGVATSCYYFAIVVQPDGIRLRA